jgi:hypothetical protein
MFDFSNAPTAFLHARIARINELILHCRAEVAAVLREELNEIAHELRRRIEARD